MPLLIRRDITVVIGNGKTRARDARGVQRPDLELSSAKYKLEKAEKSGNREDAKTYKGVVKRLEKEVAGKDALMPVGAEDPERALALKKHEEGVTKSQDKTKAKDATKCQCESSVCGGHGKGSCGNTATREVPTIYGKYLMCRNCAEALSKDFKKGTDMKARDIQASEIREKLGISESDWAALSKDERQKKALQAVRGKDSLIGHDKPTKFLRTLAEAAVKAGETEKKFVAQFRPDSQTGARAAYKEVAKAKDVLPIPIKTSNAVPMPAEEDDRERYANDHRRKSRDRGRFVKAGDAQMTEYEKGLREHIKRLNKEPQSAMRDRLIRTVQLAIEKGITREDAARLIAKATDGVDRYEVMEGPGGFEVWVNGLLEATKSTQQAAVAWAKADGAYSDTIKVTRMRDARATDAKAVMPLQASGSEPGDHMLRANQYEIAGDRARALDSYRAAASGYRKANDRANEAKARDGIEACQAKFATQYDHPGKGRTKVCDSAESALRTAVERTRAGESVHITDGKTVRPRTGDSSPMPTKWQSGPPSRPSEHTFEPNKYKECKTCGLGVSMHKKKVKDDTGGPPPVDNPRTPAVTAPVPDEHEGFKKLEGKLSKEKGVTDPAALAASIGRKKYGAEGMAKKSAAGRAKDSREVQPV